MGSFQTGAAKLCDFGFARTVGHGCDDELRPLTPMCTTLWYRAPELLYGARFYGPAVDLWLHNCGALHTAGAFQGTRRVRHVVACIREARHADRGRVGGRLRITVFC